MEIKEYAKYNADEIRGLYSQVGWTAYTENMKALEQGYQNSLLVLAAYESDELLGIVRVVGDGWQAFASAPCWTETTSLLNSKVPLRSNMCASS